MSATEVPQSEIDLLNKEYEAYIRGLQAAWLRANPVHSRDVYEVMSSADRKEVHDRMAQWARYITPIGEQWWKERGYGVVWPADDSQPMLVHKLETA